jgi:hypothetical protein
MKSDSIDSYRKIVKLVLLMHQVSGGEKTYEEVQAKKIIKNSNKFEIW